MGAETNTAGTGMALRLADEWAQRIEQRLLLPGSRLPSVRAGARLHGVSPFTIVAAYDRLQAAGLVEARPQRGFFVRELGRSLAPARSRAPALSPAAPFEALTLMRSLMASDATPGPAHGTLPPDWLDAGLLRQAVQQALREDGDALLLRYGDPQGDPVLREALLPHLAELGLDCDSEQVLSTVGATHALALIASSLTQPGDAVLVDDPGWPIEYARLTQAGLRLLPLPRGAQGPDLARLATLVREHRPRLYVTVSVLHNPTGHSLTPAHAHEILRLTQECGCTLVEDDTYAAFAPPHQVRLAALDGLRRTLYVGGFAKVLGAGLRVGFVAGPASTIANLSSRKLVQQLSSAALNERALAHLLRRGALRRHVERLNQRLAQARARCLRLAEQAGCRFSLPPAGLFGWLDTGQDSETLAARLALQGWRCAPEPLFSPSRRAGPHLRINFAVAAQQPAFWRALRR